MRPLKTQVSSSGFTLIEILAVVLIIGALFAMAAPRYRRAVERSRADQAMNLLRVIYSANKLYYLNNNCYAQGTFPSCGSTSTTGSCVNGSANNLVKGVSNQGSYMDNPTCTGNPSFSFEAANNVHGSSYLARANYIGNYVSTGWGYQINKDSLLATFGFPPSWAQL